LLILSRFGHHVRIYALPDSFHLDALAIERGGRQFMSEEKVVKAKRKRRETWRNEGLKRKREEQGGKARSGEK
jgi:hypothetical protein